MSGDIVRIVSNSTRQLLFGNRAVAVRNPPTMRADIADEMV